MSLLETLKLEHLPLGYDIHVALFKDVTNAEFLQKQLVEGNADFEYALIDASIIISRIHVLAAAYRAINDLLENRLRSRNVHSEIVFCLSPNNNIANSFRHIGITPTTTSLLLIKVTTPNPTTIAHTPTTIQTHISTHIQGDQIPFSDESLSAITDWKKVVKLYKLGSAGGGVAQVKKKGSKVERRRARNGGEGEDVNVNLNEAGGDVDVNVDVVDEGVGKIDLEGRKTNEERKELEIFVLGCMVLRGAT